METKQENKRELTPEEMDRISGGWEETWDISSCCPGGSKHHFAWDASSGSEVCVKCGMERPSLANVPWANDGQ